MCELIPYDRRYGDGVIAVVRAVHDEYGFSWDEAGYHRDLYEIDRAYLHTGGAFWVLIDGPRVVGCVGVTVHDAANPAHDPQGDVTAERPAGFRYCELHRLYLDSAYRGRRLGRKMLDAAMAFGRAHGCTRMIAWSDVKLPHAHRMYLDAGFVQCGSRICDDPDKATECGFWKEPL